MMSSPDDQSCSNISTSFSSSRPAAPPRSARRKQQAEKRKSTSSEEEKKKKRLSEEEESADAQTNRKTPQKKKDTGRSIKTSSSFKHNPEIPEIHRPDVSQLKEKIFTSDSFSDLSSHPHSVATSNKVSNVSTVTSVQKQTIPVLSSGRDAVVRSQTGSGKTSSYAVPVVQSSQAVQPKVSRSDGPSAVVIVPTRELAQQTFSIFQKLSKPFTWIVPGVSMGGEKRKAEKARLRKGINISISTPGRSVDHIRNTSSIAFSAVRWSISDEADRTLDLGFEKDSTIILNSLNSNGPSRQNVSSSATLTQGVTRLADVCLHNPVSINVSGPASSDLTASSTSNSDPSAASQSESFAVPEASKQFVVVVPSKVRLVCSAAFISDKCKFSQNNKLIVFVSSCEAVEFLHSLFTSVLSGPSTNHKPRISFMRLHGNMKQEERSEVFQQFSGSRSGVSSCTDVAARGSDLPQVTWIVQYTPPTAAAEYVHRVGRTARIGGGGSSSIFLTPAETAFINESANHNISLSDMKSQDISSSSMMDDTYKGRGKYHSKSSSKASEQETRERATVLQTEFENFVHTDAQSVQSAKKASQSFSRAYTTYPAHLKHVFHIRSLHSGHTAKSFGLRDAPQGSSAAGPPGPGNKNRNKNQARSSVKNQNQAPSSQTTTQSRPRPKRLSPGQREVRLFRSEFSSGLEEGDAKKKKKKKKKKTIGQSGEEEEES